MRIILNVFFLLSVFVCVAQHKPDADSLHKAYNGDMKMASNSFSESYFPNRAAIYSLNEAQFLKKIDSLKKPFILVSNKYADAFEVVDNKFIPREQKDISYFFDKIIVDYPYFHENYTGEKIQLSKPIQIKLDRHLKEFNNPGNLSSKDFKNYVEAFLRHQSTIEVKKASYKKSDNKRLDAYLNLIPRYFKNLQCKEYWQYHYLFNHLDNWGSKNVGKAIQSFLATCKNATYTRTIDSIYTESRNSYNGHLIKSYKIVDGFNLDLHIFIPDSSFNGSKRPVIVYFSGGSWTEGTPEWDFYNCANYAKKGWVAVSVEYRVSDRYETTPFEAVKDARSAIRWLRSNADIYGIDTNRIVASGNSAGGHLVLTTAMADEINENTDNLGFSASPNLLLVNSGVFDLTWDEGTAWIGKGLVNKKFVHKISPRHLLRKNLPPILMIHGTNDQSVNYYSAKSFTDEMKSLGNDFEFHTLEGAHHYIWYDRRYSGKVAELRRAFLKKYGYE